MLSGTHEIRRCAASLRLRGVRDASSTEHIAATVSLNNDKATELFATSGQDLAALRAAALARPFKAVPLRASIAIQAKNQVREIDSANVVAKIEGNGRRLSRRFRSPRLLRACTEIEV
jgi:hypothetical protein